LLTPSVTIVIVNWNSGAFLARCLDHLARQTFVPTQILVFDNGSSDRSVECASRYPGVIVRLTGENLGFAKANNRAVAEAHTDFVALLNADANPAPDWLERLMAAATANPDVVSFASRQMMDGASGILDGLGDAYHISGLVWRVGFGRHIRPKDLLTREIFSACGAAALYRREAFVAAGGFDEDYFCYCEDVDLGFRLRLAGRRCLLVPDAVVFHHGAGSSGGHGSDFSIYHGHRNLVWTFFKDMPGALFWLLLPIHIVQNLAMIAMFAMRGKTRVILRSKWDALRGLPRAWRKRRSIQADRVASLGQIWDALEVHLTQSIRDRIRHGLR
jgi:GT2 family glycosyltransferase